jgi:hypothetical protein
MDAFAQECEQWLIYHEPGLILDRPRVALPEGASRILVPSSAPASPVLGEIGESTSHQEPLETAWKGGEDA